MDFLKSTKGGTLWVGRGSNPFGGEGISHICQTGNFQTLIVLQKPGTNVLLFYFELKISIVFR